MDRVSYLTARLRQLRAQGFFSSGFSSWLARLELGEQPSGSRYTSVRRMTSLIAAVNTEIRQRSGK